MEVKVIFTETFIQKMI